MDLLGPHGRSGSTVDLLDPHRLYGPTAVLRFPPQQTTVCEDDPVNTSGFATIRE